eukprot:16122603-Heterocapsa_arctica.AAC.1
MAYAGPTPLPEFDLQGHLKQDVLPEEGILIQKLIRQVMGQEAELRMPVGDDLAHAFFKEK